MYLELNIIYCYQIEDRQTIIRMFQTIKKRDFYSVCRYINYSQTLVPRTRMGRTLWLARTDLKVPPIFLIFLSKKKPLLEH